MTEITLQGPDGVEHTLIIEGSTARAIYDDGLAQVMAALGGRRVTRRASHVEPDDSGGWYADMGPVGGPLLRWFGTRHDALEAERGWLLSAGIPMPREAQ